MDQEYLLVHRSVLPLSFSKVVEVKEMLRKGEAADVSEAVRMAGLSRSTYYKYKDFIFEPDTADPVRTAVVSVVLNHEAGVLGGMLTRLSEAGVSVLAIDQSLPIRNKAAVMLSLDLSGMDGDVKELEKVIAESRGTEQVRVVAVS